MISKYGYLVLLLVLLISCGNSNKPDDGDNYTLPFKVGYKNIFDIYQVDTYGNKVGDVWYQDTLTCYKEEIIDGKKALFFYQMDEEGNKFDAEIYCFENNILYIHSNFIDLLLKDIAIQYTPLKLPFKPNKKWIEFINFNQKNWIITDETIKNFDVGFDSFADGNLKIMGEHQQDSSLTFFNKKYQCKKYLLNLKFDGIITDTIYKVTYDLKADLSLEQYINSELGKVRTIYKPSKLTIGNKEKVIWGFGTFFCKN